MLSHTSVQGCADSVPASASVTIITNHNGRLTKRIELINRKLSISSGGALTSGDYRTVSASTPTELAAVIATLSECEALTHGTAKSGALTGAIATADNIASGRAPANAIARSRENFHFHGACAGILMLDLDIKDAPPAAYPTSLGDARARLIVAAPALASVPMLAIPSASANIFRVGSDDSMRGLSGIRLYVWVRSAADIPEIGKRLDQRLRLSGAGFAKVTTPGVVYVVSVLDTYVWQPERLDFAAGASCEAGLEQRRAARSWNEDASLLSLNDIPALSPAETQTLAAMDAATRAAAKPQADQQRAAWLAQREKEGHATSLIWSESSGGAVEYLAASHEVRLASGAWVSVGEILHAPKQYEGVKCYDPLEPDYDGGRIVAKIYAADGIIHSKAHGVINYVLRLDASEEFSAGATSTPTTDEAPLSVRAGLAQFNDRFAFVRSLGAILHTPRTGIWELMPMATWRDYTKPETAFDGKTAKSIAALWLAHRSRRIASRLVFEPELPPLSLVPSPNADPEPAFNTWPGLATTPSLDGSCDLFLRHLRDVVSNGDAKVYEWVLMWLAGIVQKPAELPGTALILKGAQGAGKDTVGEVMRRIVGPALHTTISDPEQLTSRFNAPHEGRLLIQVEEGFFAGDPRNRGKLKHMVTASSISIERKNVDRYEARNCARILITSNEEWVVPAELGNRRFQVLDVSDRYAHDLPYHGALRTQIFDKGGCATLLHHLLNEVVIDWDIIRRPLATAALRDQQIASLSPDQRWLLELLGDGALPADEDGDGTSPKALLFQSYDKARRGRPATAGDLTRFLGRYGVRVSRPRVNGALGQRVYQFPPLSECRARFGQEFAVSPEWDEQETWLACENIFSGSAATAWAR
jgi:hypothetical protein